MDELLDLKDKLREEQTWCSLWKKLAETREEVIDILFLKLMEADIREEGYTEGE